MKAASSRAKEGSFKAVMTCWDEAYHSAPLYVRLACSSHIASHGDLLEIDVVRQGRIADECGARSVVRKPVNASLVEDVICRQQAHDASLYRERS